MRPLASKAAATSDAKTATYFQINRRRSDASRLKRSSSLGRWLPVHLVRPNDHGLWDVNSQASGSRQVDRKLDLQHLVDRQDRGLGAAQDTADVARSDPSDQLEVGAVREERTLLDPLLAGQ